MGLRVLIADDDPRILGMLRRGLHYAGFEVIEASDGEEALRAALTAEPDLVVLDIGMPKLDGYAVCTRLRERRSTVPILMLTARGELPDRIAGLRGGADDYLLKPFAFQELTARLEALARRAGLTAGALVLITRRALAPVRNVADVADQVARTSDLRARVPDAPGEDELARLTTSINRMLGRLEISDAALRRLIGDASHELRTPITSLRGNLELLMGDKAVTEEDRAAALADAYAEAQDLGQLVEDLLELARADAAPSFEQLPVPALVEGLPPERVTVDAAAADARIAGDRTSLRAMVRNLVENAERYAGSWAMTVALAGAMVELRVIDHGPGIPADERSAVFARFARGSAAGTAAGSGIGLAIVDAVTRSHGGDVRIEDTPGGGATFVVRLPMVRAGAEAR